MTSAATSGLFVVDIYENWSWHWVRAWKDLGQLIVLHAEERHIARHETERFNSQTKGGWCMCFNCRVVEAWTHRHDHLKPAPRPARARRKGT